MLPWRMNEMLPPGAGVAVAGARVVAAAGSWAVCLGRESAASAAWAAPEPATRAPTVTAMVETMETSLVRSMVPSSTLDLGSMLGSDWVHLDRPSQPRPSTLSDRSVEGDLGDGVQDSRPARSG